MSRIVEQLIERAALDLSTEERGPSKYRTKVYALVRGSATSGNSPRASSPLSTHVAATVDSLDANRSENADNLPRQQGQPTLEGDGTMASVTDISALPDYAPVPPSALGPAVNEQGYYVGQVERNLYWVTEGVYQCAFLTTPDGVVLFDAPPTIGHNIQRAIDEIAAANGVSNKVTHLVHSHHHADHVGASSLFGKDVVRIGHEETRRLLLRDNDPARPPLDETFPGSPHARDRR